MEMKFEHNALEKDIERLSKEVLERKTRPEHAETSEREIVKSVIGEQIKAQPSPAPAQIQSPILPKYMQQESPEAQLQVEQLIDLAFHKGVDEAVKEAKKQGPFILDALHDSLTSKLYEELKSRKLI